MKKIILGLMLLPVVAFGLNEKFLEDWGNKAEVQKVKDANKKVGGWEQGTQNLYPDSFSSYDRIEFPMSENNRLDYDKTLSTKSCAVSPTLNFISEKNTNVAVEVKVEKNNYFSILFYIEVFKKLHNFSIR